MTQCNLYRRKITSFVSYIRIYNFHMNIKFEINKHEILLQNQNTLLRGKTIH